MTSRASMYSTLSAGPGTSLSRTPQQLSTTTLLNALHTCYTTGQAYPLESSTSLVVNTWVTGLERAGGVVDGELANRAWEHARRRAEDGCIVLGSTHESTPSLLIPFISSLPLAVPSTLFTALNAIRPFLHCVTPSNPSTPRHSSLAAIFTLSMSGDITGASLSLSTSGIDVKNGLLQIRAEPGFRAFDVFYYLLTSASPAEREHLNLLPASKYELLKKSDTYTPPSYLPTADDAAAAEDFRESLKAIGIKGAALRNMLSVIAALLKLGDTLGFFVDEDVLETTCEEVADLLDLEVEVLKNKCDSSDRQLLIAAVYEALVDWVLSKANEAIRMDMRNARIVADSSNSDHEGVIASSADPHETDSASLTVVEVPNAQLCKAIALRTVFDNTHGINAEMTEDGVPVVNAGSSVIKEMKSAIAENEADLDLSESNAAKHRVDRLDKRDAVLEKVGFESEADSFFRRLLYPVDGQGIVLGKSGRFNLASLLASSRVWFHLAMHPTDATPASLASQAPGVFPWSAGAVSGQIRAWRLAEWANYRNKQLDYTSDFDHQEFSDRYARLGCQDGREGIESWIMERGWSNGEIIIGTERIWMREATWWEAESMLDMIPIEDDNTSGMMRGYQVSAPMIDNGIYGAGPFADPSQEHLLSGNVSQFGPRSIAPTIAGAQTMRSVRQGDYGLGSRGDDKKGITYYGEVEEGDGKIITEIPITRSRKIWVGIVWALTGYIPSFLLRWVGRMKRPDVRFAWREKFALIILIFLMNAIVIFYIVFFGKLLCPNSDKAWNAKEVAEHTGTNDYYASFRGHVYDLTKFYKIQHSDTSTETTATTMLEFAGTDVSEYIRPPLTVACPGLVTDTSLVLLYNTTLTYPTAEHNSGPVLETLNTTKLHSINWYRDDFLPRMKEYYKGDLVVKTSKVRSEGENESRMWFTMGNKIYDMTDYFYTLDIYDSEDTYNFFGDTFNTIVEDNPGGDITSDFNKQFVNNITAKSAIQQCLDNTFYVGMTDFRDTPRCQVNNYLLLAFTIILCTVILTKFLAALQFGSKRRPAPQDKFVICQVPAYTEGEDHLRKGLDSLTSLAYDNKRKLICVICDGMIVGGGNDRPTPKIVLDILGVDPKMDPPALPFKSVGTGNEQLNYGKVYSGLYEFEGNVVPYIVVVKVGKESEQSKSKPGNRGKRDSQILLMSFLNRVHHRSPMSPLELEMFHQINNVIGVDPELYEYLLMVDADTLVKEDALTRLVASCANDAKIAGICGETSLENEERSWWTMIQVYEYYISHHLAKAFESLFGSVTCLPGCFTMYRLRTADKGKPLIISDAIINEYSFCNVDTLHKKNLLSLGEDRFLTTLMLKHFPHHSFKFVPDAYALTAAPEEWSVLLSQRRRWINSTIHNLAELMFIEDMCGFCCFSMRFVVFVDLFGTVILPATCVYLVYMIARAASGTGAFPVISICMLAGVYGLQALIFIIKRQWQHIGWMLCYLLAYPVYSFILPIYSFWKQDDFSWGNTRVVIGEKGNKQIVAVDEEIFDPRSIPLQRWDDYAMMNGLPGARGNPDMEKEMMYQDYPGQPGYEMDDMHSMYSSVKPASTVLTGFQHGQMQQNMPYRPPAQSPNPFSNMNRMSSYSRYTDFGAGGGEQGHLMSMAGHSENGQYSPQFSRENTPMMGRTGITSSQTDLLSPQQSPPLNVPYQRSTFTASTRPQSMIALSRPQSRMSLGLGGFQTRGISDAEISAAVAECLGEVDLDTVTKKQLKALAEQKLATQLDGVKRTFLDGEIDRQLAEM